MSGAFLAVAACVACLSGGAAVATAALARNERRKRALRREAALGARLAGMRRKGAARDFGGWGLRYAEQLTRRLFTGLTEPLTPSVRGKRAAETRAGRRFREQAVEAGCAKEVSTAAFCEACTRLAVAGGLAGALAGVVFSTEMAFLLAAAGAFAGYTAPGRSLAAARRERALCAERHLSEMLEVVALGLRSGLTFDRSFELYGSHFENDLASSCTKAHRRWALGLTTREEALREFAASYDCEQLDRIVDSVVRSLRLGSSLTGVLEEAAAQSRATYRTALEERVAKAPVKMMLPTGTLILPAMLLLVMGPVLLELAGGF